MNVIQQRLKHLEKMYGHLPERQRGDRLEPYQNLKVRKHSGIQKIVGKHQVIMNVPFPAREKLKLHYDNKPSSIKMHKWLYPAIVYSLREDPFFSGDLHSVAEEMYNKILHWQKYNFSFEEVTISGKVRHLSMCFETHHFASCGRMGGVEFKKSFRIIYDPKSFCIFTQDKKGQVTNRCICSMHLNRILVHNMYGSHKSLEPKFIELLQRVSGLKVYGAGDTFANWNYTI